MRGISVWVWVVLAAATLGGCGGKPKLTGAMTPIPVYASAEVVDQHSAITSDDLNNISKFSTYSWILTTRDPWNKVEAFYAQQLQGATREEEPAEDGEPATVQFVWKAPGSQPEEKVFVTIQKGARDGRTQFRISEDIMYGRR